MDEEKLERSRKEKTYLEKGLPEYLENDIKNLKEGIKNKVLHINCLVNEVQGSIWSNF